jgi:hypothetical protein
MTRKGYGRFVWEKTDKELRERRLDPRLYTPEQVLAYAGNLPPDHPGWMDPPSKTDTSEDTPEISIITEEKHKGYDDKAYSPYDNPNWECRTCNKWIHGLKPEHCMVCHETFSGTRAADLHRKNGRCLSVLEMVKKNFSQNRLGYWGREYG